MRPPDYTSLPNNFWLKVDESHTGCWLWNAGRYPDGYGMFGIGAFPKRAHRLAAEDALGAIPKDIYVLHHCDTPLCVNPEHLYYGTQQQNMDDMKARGRQDRTRGVDKWNSKLTAESVREIRRLKEKGWTQKQLSKRFGVTTSRIWEVANHVSWTHV